MNCHRKKIKNKDYFLIKIYNKRNKNKRNNNNSKNSKNTIEL